MGARLTAAVCIQALTFCASERASAYDCPTAPPAIHDLSMEPFYAKGSNSEVDPAKLARYANSSRDLDRYIKIIQDQSDTFVRSRAEGARTCAMKGLSVWAAVNAMSGKHTRQGRIKRDWALGSLCLAYLKLGGDQRQSVDEVVKGWFSRLAGEVVAVHTSRRMTHGADAETNLYYWAGMSVGCVGVALDNDAYWRFGSDAFERAMAHIGPDGVLPIELRRGKRAAMYHEFSAQPLVVLARLGKYRGDEIQRRNGEALDRLVNLVRALRADPQILAERVGSRQEALPELKWLGLYERLQGAGATDTPPQADKMRSNSRLGGDVAALDKALNEGLGRP